MRPTNWAPSNDVNVPPPTTPEEADKRAASAPYEVRDRHFARKRVA